jgi:hypothetical protein
VLSTYEFKDKRAMNFEDPAKKIALSVLERMYKKALKLEQRETDDVKDEIDILQKRKRPSYR